MFDHDVGDLCRERRIRVQGHADFGILSNFAILT